MWTTRVLLDEGPKAPTLSESSAKRSFHRLVDGSGPATGQQWEMHRPPCCFNLFLPLLTNRQKGS